MQEEVNKMLSSLQIESGTRDNLSAELYRHRDELSIVEGACSRVKVSHES